MARIIVYRDEEDKRVLITFEGLTIMSFKSFYVLHFCMGYVPKIYSSVVDGLKHSVYKRLRFLKIKLLNFCTISYFLCYDMLRGWYEALRSLVRRVTSREYSNHV